MSVKARVLAVVVVSVLAVAGAVGYAWHAASRSHARTSTAVATAGLARIEGGPRIVFRNTSLGPDYGKVAMVSLADPGGPRAITGLSCDRVYASTQQFLCLSSEAGVVPTYKAQVLGTQLQTLRSLPLAGIPSRARLSADGALAATTSFTAGDSYAGTSFSTRTVISHLPGSQENLEDFTLIRDGHRIAPTDRNYWGVTFAKDDTTFYATVAFGKHTYLVRGDLTNHTMTILHTDAECPSLSPDGKTVVYKKRAGSPVGQWRLASYDVASGKETMLAENTNVDDQVEWLDDNTVIYGVPRAGSAAAIDDVYALPADGTGSPRLLIAQAWSPAVVH